MSQINDSISASMLIAPTEDSTSIMIETTSWPESSVPIGMALDDLLAGAFTPEGKLRVLMT